MKANPEERMKHGYYKAVPVLLAAALIAGTAGGCGKKEEKTESTAETTAAPAPIYAHTDIVAAEETGSVLGRLPMEIPEVEPIPEYITNGTSHWAIPELQERLMELGFMDSDEPTDYYGSATESAVKKFQRQMGLKQDGVVGPETYDAIMADDAKYYTVKKDDDGDDVVMIQQRLYQLGYLATEDQITGHFGDKTLEAVIRLQENNNIEPDGLIGMRTVNLIYSDEVKANLLAFGEESELVLAAQKRLNELGYMTSKPDGKYGGDTAAAIKTFQRKNGIIMDGYLGPETRMVLLSSSALPNGLGLGDDGETVQRVQTLLAKWGYMPKSNISGYFGEITLKAVKNFQSRNGLSPDGLVGKQTIAKLSADKAKGPAPASSSSSSSHSSSSSSSSSAGSTSSSSSGSKTTAKAAVPAGSGVPDTSASGVSGSVGALLATARSKLGCPYVYGSKGPNSFDCSGFVYWCLNNTGVTQSYITSSGWAGVGKYTRISSYYDLRAGDIIVVSGHVGIISTDGYIIDASSSNGRVIERPLGSWWANHFIVGWRIF